MAKLYLLGGEDAAERDSKEINEQAFADASGKPAVLVFSWTARAGEKTRRYRKIMSDYFQDLGARSVEFAELSYSWQRVKEKVEASDLTYLPGGDAGLLVERIRSAEADSLIQSYDRVSLLGTVQVLSLSARTT